LELRTSEPRRGDIIVGEIIVEYLVGFGIENFPSSPSVLFATSFAAIVALKWTRQELKENKGN
jgi:hypothetical protein